MDAFESIVAAILQDERFWIRTSVKVKLELEKKRNKSDPRTEIDVVAFRPSTNELWVVECKSFLNSPGVKLNAFLESDNRDKSRYKLFVESPYWDNVRDGLLRELKFLPGPPGNTPKVWLCLAAGKIAGADGAKLEQHFESHGWKLLGPDWLVPRMRRLAMKGYENDVMTMTAKLLLRKGGRDKPGNTE